MTLTFKVKDNSIDGDYQIKLDYEKNKDIMYLKDNKYPLNDEFPTKNIVTNSVKVSLKGSQIKEVVTEKQETEDRTMMWVAIGVSGAAVVGAGIVIGVIVAKKKGKWVKL